MKLLAPIENKKDLVNKEYVDNTVDAIEIGGRNYILNSAFINDSTGWTFDANSSIDTDRTFNGHPSMKVELIGQTASVYDGAVTYNLPHQNGLNVYTDEQWTISGWYYVEDISTVDLGIGLSFRGRNSSNTLTTIGELRMNPTNIKVGSWTKMSTTITVNADYTGCLFQVWIRQNGIAWFTDLKLERGGKATDWTPAPEDFYTTATPIGYGTCNTAAATVEKVVTISGDSNWTLTSGAMVCVKFTNTNTAQNPTLNVNGTGAKRIVYGASLISTSNLGYAGYANRYINYVYDGTQYVFIGWSLDSNTTYSTMTGATSSAAGTSGLVPAPAAGKQASFLRGDGTWVVPADTKVAIAAVAPTTATAYYPTLHTATSGIVSLKSSDDYNVVTLEGTAESDGLGYTNLRLGNKDARGTAGNKFGQLTLYSQSTGYSIIKAADTTGAIAHTLPATAGILLNTGTTSFTQTLTSGTKIGSIKINGESKDIYAPTNTDTKVNTILATETKAYLLGTSTAPTSTAKGVTAVADTGVYLGTGAGTLYAEQFNANSRSGVNFIGDDFTKGDTPTEKPIYWTLGMCDKNGIAHANRLGYLATAVDTNGNVTTGIYAMPNVVGSTTTNGIVAGIKPDGSSYIKLGSNTVGSATQPVYLNGGYPTACTYTLAKSVPSNAVFTDTTPTIQQNATTNSGKNFYPVFVDSNNTSNADEQLYTAPAFIIQRTYGTSDSIGKDQIILGNATSKGMISFYNGKYFTGFIPDTLTGNRTLTLPDKTGTLALIDDIPTIPTSLKNPYALTIQGNGNTLPNGVYDGSAAKTVNITPESIGAASNSNFVKSGTDAQAGLVPAPPTTAGTTKYLREDGNWVVPANNKVTQAAAITTAGEYPIILGYNTATTSQTNTVNKTSTLLYNPDTQILRVPKINIYYDSSSHSGTIESSSATGLTLYSTGDNAGTVGKATNAFSGVFARALISQCGGVEYGRLHRQKEGTAEATGIGTLVIGNSTGSGTAGNATGWIKMYGTGIGSTTIKPGYNSTGDIAITLPDIECTLPRPCNVQSGVFSPGEDVQSTTITITRNKFKIRLSAGVGPSFEVEPLIGNITYLSHLISKGTPYNETTIYEDDTGVYGFSVTATITAAGVMTIKRINKSSHSIYVGYSVEEYD